MRIEYKTGDLLAGPERVIAHGCNALGVMGSGIAAQIRAKYPAAYADYRTWFMNIVRDGALHALPLGETQFVQCGDRIIVNAITQATFGRDPSVLYASYDAIRSCIERIDALASATQSQNPIAGRYGEIREVGFPLIGAGLANGSWKKISGIIEEEAKSFQPIVYLYDGVMPTN